MVNNACVRVNSYVAAIICSIAALAAAPPAPAAGLIYVNRCAAGCTVTPGFDNAIAGKSSIPISTSNLSAFAHGDAVFSDTVICLRSLFARYDVNVITANPGAVARREMMLAGNATQLGLSPGTAGVAPGGSAADNRIAFAFANDIGADADKLCWIAASQTSGTVWARAEYHCPDVTSYLSGLRAEDIRRLSMRRAAHTRPKRPAPTPAASRPRTPQRSWPLGQGSAIVSSSMSSNRLDRRLSRSC
jgi:hypothetical protein